MAAIEDLFGRLRAEAAIRGEDWLQRQLGALLSQDGGDMGRMASGPSCVQTGQAASGPEHTGVVLAESGPERSVRGAVRAHGDTIQVASGPDHTGMGAASSGPSHTGRGASRTRSSRPPRRYSPSISPGRQRGDSGHSRAPSGPPAKRAAGIVSEGPAGGTRSSVGARGGRPGGSDAAALPARRVDQAVTGPVVGSRRVGSQATVASPPASSASHLQEVERVGSNRVTPSRKASAKSPHGSRARRGSESGPGPSASGTEPPGGSSSEEEDRSEGERSGSEDEVLPRTIPATRDSRRSADGIASTQPGAFLIPYSIMLFFTGLPLFLMELSLGQYGAAGPITVWKCCPILKGIGVGMLLVSSLVSLYYNVIIAWTFYYLGRSFQSPLPWSCQAPKYIQLCANTSGNGSQFSATEAFWNEEVLGVVHSSGLSDPGPVRWQLALCLLAAWIIIFLCMLKGIHSSGKIVYFTATFPYVVLVVLIIRGATLEGSIDGVRFYLTADWKRLQSAQVWNDAASQIFYSLGIGFGGLLSMASYNKFDNNVIRDTLVIAIGNCCTSFFAGFAIFSILGHMAWKKRVPVGEVADSGPGLAFVAYPEALALLPGSVFWSILFFLMLFTLGVDTLFGNMEGIVTAVLDEFPALRDWKRKTMFLGGLCFFFYLMGLLLVTEGGIYWFTLIDSYSTSFGLIIITLFMCLGIAFFYGVNQFCQDIVDMICHCPPWCTKLLLYFKACWVFCTPVLLLFILFYIFMEMYNTPLHYGHYEYPRWGKALGICLGTLCCIQIPIWAGVAIFRESGTLVDRFRNSLRPLNSWRSSSNQRDPSSSIIDVPYTVNLTDQDFNDPVWQTGGASEA